MKTEVSVSSLALPTDAKFPLPETSLQVSVAPLGTVLSWVTRPQTSGQKVELPPGWQRWRIVLLDIIILIVFTIVITMIIIISIIIIIIIITG